MPFDHTHTPPMPSRGLVVVTYNIHAGVGLDGRTDIARIGDVLARLDPDIVGLQEVLSAHPGATGGQVAALAERLGMSTLLGTTMCRDAGPYGNALLTRLPILDSSCLDLSVAGQEPRSLMRAVLEHEGRRMTVMNTHLGVRVRERHAQVTRCAHLLEANDDDSPLVVMGDFNSWLPRGDVLGKLQMHFGGQPAPRSYPVRRPVFALDRIWTRPSTLLREVHAYTSIESRLASDHLPVWARLAPLRAVA